MRREIKLEIIAYLVIRWVCPYHCSSP